MQKPPFVELDRPDAAVRLSRRANGEVIVACPRPLPPFAGHIIDILAASAARFPERAFLAQRDATGAWRYLSYARALGEARIVAQWLLDAGLAPARPVMILSGNSLEHAVMMLGAMAAGVPVAPVSVAYSLTSRDFAKLRNVRDLVEPGLVFVQDGAAFSNALAALDPGTTPVVHVANAPAVARAVPFAEVMRATPGPAVEAARARQGPDSIAKILFTSGSTGTPKGVVNTQRMLCAVATMIAEVSEPEDPDDPPIILDWLPWNHTFGGNANFNAIMLRGGTLHIDAGLPTPELFRVTLANLKDVAPTRFSSVPAAYAALAEALERDAALRTVFFSRMRILSYGGAPLPQDLFERMQALAVATIGRRIPFSTGHGATETGALDTAVYWNTERVGLIGLPTAGTELKLVPAGDAFEVRVRGPQVTPGYYRQPELTAEAFDEEGFFRLGDAARWVDPDDPRQGLVFAGRLSENFKLASGTWVATGALRTRLLTALSPLVSDLLLTGEEEIGVLAWPNMAGLAAFAEKHGLSADTRAEGLPFHPAVCAELRARLAVHNSDNPASSTRVGRLMMMLEPPSIDAGEITDKRYVNQRAALTRRAELVVRLFAEPADPRAIVLD